MGLSHGSAIIARPAIARSRAETRLPPPTDCSSSRPAGSRHVCGSCMPIVVPVRVSTSWKPSAVPPTASAKARARSLADFISSRCMASSIGHTSPALAPALFAGWLAARALTVIVPSWGSVAEAASAVRTLVSDAGGRGTRSALATSTAPVLASTRM